MPGVEVTSCERRDLLLALQVDQQALGHLRRDRRVDLRGPRRRGVAVDRQARVAEVARGIVVGVVGGGRVRVEQDRRLLCSSLVFAVEPAARRRGRRRRAFGVVLVGVVAWASVVGVGGGVSDAFGVTCVSGIFGGLITVADGSFGFVLGAVPGVLGVVVAAPGVVGAGVVGVGAWATVLTTTARLRRAFASAPRTAAAAAPSTSTATRRR